MEFEDVLSIALGIFFAVVIVDVCISRREMQHDSEYITTSKGRKLYVEVSGEGNVVSILSGKV